MINTLSNCSNSGIEKESNKSSKRILVTALGTMNCTTIVNELRKQPENYYIIGADINLPYCIYGSTEVDEYYQFPKATEDRELYFEFVRQFCIDHNVNIYYCVVDEEVETMALHREELSDIGVTLCVANTDAVVTCHRKEKFAIWSEQNIPEYCIKRFSNYEDVSDEDFPLFVKPIEGRASIGCRAIHDRKELDSLRDNWYDFIVQEFTQGEFIAADIVRCRKTGLIQVCQRQELMRNSNGCGVAVEIVANEEVEKACRKIAELLDLNGVVNTEFFVGKNGIKIIEINPRIPAGVAYSCMAGLNLVTLALRIAQGEAITVANPIKLGAHYAKRYETFEVLPNKTTNQGLRLTTFSYLYLTKSLYWLNDEEIRRGMDIQYTVTSEMQKKWFEALPSRSDYMIWGLEYNGIAIGAGGFRNIKPKQQGELTCYIGEKAYRGMGLAPLLIEELEKKALDLEFKRIVLKVLISNERAYSLYFKCGFVEIGRDNKFITMAKQI
jgi:carbamoyl-phosphate synthase large subunit